MVHLLYPGSISVVFDFVINIIAHLILIHLVVVRFLHATSCTVCPPFYHALLASFKWRIRWILKPHLLELLIQSILINELLPVFPGLRSVFTLLSLRIRSLILWLRIHYILVIPWFWQSSLVHRLLIVISHLLFVRQILIRILILRLVWLFCNFWFGLLLLEIVTVIIGFVYGIQFLYLLKLGYGFGVHFELFVYKHVRIQIPLEFVQGFALLLCLLLCRGFGYAEVHVILRCLMVRW